MSYQTISLPVVGPTDQVQARDQDYQLSQNYYAYPSEAGIALHGTPGTTLFSATFTSGADRGFHVFNNQLYQVSGETLELIAEDSTRTQLGTIAGTGRCIFADDGIDMFIVTGGVVYRYNTSLSTVTDTDLESPKGVAYINKTFIYDGNGNRWVASEVGDGSDIRTDNYAEAESNPDDTTLVYAFEERLYILCEKTIEPWTYTGEGAPPLTVIDTAVIQKGTKAPYSVANTDSYMYFLGDDLNIYQMRGNQVRNISNSGIAEEINAMTATNDAIGFCFNLKGLDFYYITFPTGNRSFLYSEAAQQITTLSYGVSGDRHLASSYAYVYGKHLVADRRNGRVLEWDWNENTDNGDVLQRKRIFPPVTGEMMGVPGKRLQMSRIELEMAAGVGTATGEGYDPEIIIEVSTDGGHSWERLENAHLGKAGEFDQKVEAYHLKQFRRLVIRTTQTDPVLSSITAAAIDLKAGGY